MFDERPEEDNQAWLDERIDHEARPVAETPVPVAVREEAPAGVTDDAAPGEDVEAAADTSSEGDAVHQEGLVTVDRVHGLITSLEATPIAPAKASVLKSILKNIRASIDNAITLLDAQRGEAPTVKTEAEASTSDLVDAGADTPKREALEGVFNGSAMVGDDGKEYSVPPNYASKSKLVEGDMLKLYIGERGNFIYKQIGPIERQRLIGTVSFDQESGQHTVLAAGRSWKVLKASVTYYKAEVGDEAVILVPKSAPSKWAAVENVIKPSAA